MSSSRNSQKSYNKVFKCPICKKEYKYFKWLVKHIEKIQHKKILISGESIMHQQELYDLLGMKKPIKSSRRQVKLKKYL